MEFGKYYKITFNYDIEVSLYDYKFNENVKTYKKNNTKKVRFMGMTNNNFVTLTMGTKACAIPMDSFTYTLIK